MDKSTIVKQNFEASIALKNETLQDAAIIETISSVTDKIIDTYRNDGKVLFCGNGGSAADAQHLAAELTGRYYFDRPPLNAEALHTNTSYLTAVANDYSYDEIYSRLLTAVCHRGDILIGLSTSGNSTNVVNAFKKAKELGCTTVGLTGKGGGQLKEYCDFIIEIDSENTPRIQECHMLIGHCICELVEKEMFPRS